MFTACQSSISSQPKVSQLHGQIAFLLSSHQLVGILIIPTFWLLLMKLLSTVLHRFLCGHMFSIFLGICPGGTCGIAGSCDNSEFNFSRNSPTVFPLRLQYCTALWAMHGDGISPRPHQHLLCSLILTIAILGFPHSSVGKSSACNAGDPGLILGS